MAQLFTPRSDARLRLTLIVLGLLAVLGLVLALGLARGAGAWAIGRPAAQPIPFSHAVHAGGLGLECAFCHADSGRAASAGMPAGELCLGCHQRVWNVTAQFTPLRQDTVWASVHRLPDHVRFHHGGHAAAGVGCGSCHGDVAAMPRTVKAETLSMGFCLDCHRDVVARGAEPVGQGNVVRHHGGIPVPALISCTVCHR